MGLIDLMVIPIGFTLQRFTDASPVTPCSRRSFIMHLDTHWPSFFFYWKISIIQISFLENPKLVCIKKTNLCRHFECKEEGTHAILAHFRFIFIYYLTPYLLDLWIPTVDAIIIRTYLLTDRVMMLLSIVPKKPMFFVW